MTRVNSFFPARRGEEPGACRPAAWRWCAFALALVCALVNLAAHGQEYSREQLKGLDEQVQEIKSDVLAIAAELSQLEERLLFPSNTQLSVFVSLAPGEAYRLDAVELQVNGQPVAHHIYSYKELEALRNGGVQRLYTGNVPTGSHELQVAVSGKLPSGRDFSSSESFTFNKGVEPKLVGITLGAPEGGLIAVRAGER
jgi:hypothetical protein